MVHNFDDDLYIEGYSVERITEDDELYYLEYPEEWDDGSSIGCRDCPDSECTGHCMSCAYRPL